MRAVARNDAAFAACRSRRVGYCASHSRHFWGFRLYLLCAADGMPIRYELFPANTGERDGARQMLEGLDLAGYTVLADKGLRR